MIGDGNERLGRPGARETHRELRQEPEEAFNRLLFLDLDGVLNPFLAKSNLHDDWRRVHFPDNGRYWVSPNLGRWLRRLCESGTTLVWATTWVSSPDDLEHYASLIGLPAGLDRIQFDPSGAAAGSGECAKQPGIAKWLAANSPRRSERLAVWIDDDIGPQDRAYAEGEGILTFAPHPASGLADLRLRSAIEAALA